MLLSLILSLTGLISTYIEPQPRPSPAELVGPLSASLVGLDMRADCLVQGWPLPSELSTLLAAVQPSTESGMIADVPSLLALQAADGCQPNGNVSVEYIIGEPETPVESSYTIPFKCPNGMTIMRKVTHKVSYRTVTINTTKGQSSTKPGDSCPPLETSVAFSEIASESWDYGTQPGCPGDCCILVGSVNTNEYAVQEFFSMRLSLRPRLSVPTGRTAFRPPRLRHTCENFAM